MNILKHKQLIEKFMKTDFMTIYEYFQYFENIMNIL